MEAITFNSPGGQVTYPILQPEAWISPDGQKVFFKSPDITTTDIEDENLLFIPLSKRTCQDERQNYYGSQYRLARIEGLLPADAVHIYPVPVERGRSFWIALDDLGLPAFAGEVVLADMRGRSLSVWAGECLPGQAHKISVASLAPGMYALTLIDQGAQAVRHRQKIIIR